MGEWSCFDRDGAYFVQLTLALPWISLGSVQCSKNGVMWHFKNQGTNVMDIFAAGGDAS